MKFALFFGNRGFFPETLVASAREEMCEAVKKAGHDYVCLDANKTKFGAISNEEDGLVFAKFLKEHDDEIDGAIICMPNFSDESGAVKAFREFKKPILIQAYPDEIGKMSFVERRDSFCGKVSICNYFNQCGIKYTIFKPHVVHPLDPVFIEQIQKFAKICRVVNGTKKMVIGAIGARATAFKTVRFDEVTLEKNNITVETIDLGEMFDYMDQLQDDDPRVVDAIKKLKAYTNFGDTPKDRIPTMAKALVVILNYVKQYRMDAIGIRCWNEFPAVRKISVCLLASYLSHIGIPTACEVDVYNALAMKVLSLASEKPATVMDWNNNFGKEKNKCILFHCGPMAKEMVEGDTEVQVHKMFEKSYGQNCSWGVNVGKLKSGPITYASAKVENGQIEFMAGEARITGEPVEKAFFGSYGVTEFDDLESVMMYVLRNNYHHHVSYTYGADKEVLKEALEVYLGYKVQLL
ncbi:MAG TPA: hypothetical protein GX010_04600 [Erysipelotrichaceae bacterium]|nr:hypothetical protein [Erysipelotrichaceae bacterium]